MELSIDTSTRYASVGLTSEGQAISELTWRSERNHSVELAPAIRDLMGRVGVDMAQLEAVFIAKGPGAFSALRVGVSTAKALAVALNIPLASVATLDIEAQPYLGLGVPVCAIIGAGRDRVYVGRYGAAGSIGEPVYEVVTHDDLASEAHATTLFCGEGTEAVAATLRQRTSSNTLVPDVTPPTRRASVLGKLAYQRWRGGLGDDPATLQPLYLRSAQVNMARRTWASA